MPITDWNDAYANSAHIPGAEAFFEAWPIRAAAFEADHPPEMRRYGPHARQGLRLFRPKGTCHGLVMFVHGGYWLQGEGGLYSHLAGGALARGYAVAIPSYRLAPEASIAEITHDIARALSDAAGVVEGPIYLTGHSAGGHLVCRMGCAGVLPTVLADRLAHILSISGVHDLRPLLRTDMAQPLGLTPGSAHVDSPALALPLSGVRCSAVVGADERPEFRRQTDLIANIWTGLGAETQAIHLPDEHHFSIIDGLMTPDGALTRLLLDQAP